MNARKPISKKLRFDVFKRDGFKCQYCGSCPPEVVLEPDHIDPVSNGGQNDIDNLITACFDCNRGKGARLLTTVPDSISEKAEVIAEKMEQMKAFARLLKSQKRMEEKQIDEVEAAFNVHHDGYFSPKFRESVRVFVRNIAADSVMDYMHIACGRIKDRENSLKYFCGICWKTIKDRRTS